MSGNNSQMFDMLQSQYGGNPIVANAINLARNNDFKNLEILARNICKEKGVDADFIANKYRNLYK